MTTNIVYISNIYLTNKQNFIYQIAAYADGSIFNAYIVPTVTIGKKASAVNGLRVIGGELYLHENRVQSIPAKVAFDNFVQYLKSFDKQIILVAHNGFRLEIFEILIILITKNILINL